MNSLKNNNNKKRIAVVAHEHNRVELIDWAYDHKLVLMQHEVVATEPIGIILEGVLNTPVTKLLTGPFGSPQQLALTLAEAKLDIIIFLSDPLVPGVFGKDDKALLELAVNSKVIIAANKATGDFILNSMLLNSVHLPEQATTLHKTSRVA